MKTRTIWNGEFGIWNGRHRFQILNSKFLIGAVLVAVRVLVSAQGTEKTVADGVYTGIVAGHADAGRELLIVFSDGLDTSSWLPADRVLDVAKRSDVVAYAVAIRSPAKPEFLRDLTSFTGGRLFEVEKTGNLDAIFVEILEEFRQRYLVSYTPRGVTREGWHKLDVRVKRGGTVKARPGYQS